MPARKGGKERRARRDGGSKVFTFFCFLNINTHMYGEYDATYKNALDSLAGPLERMYIHQMKECLLLLCTFHINSENLTLMYFLHHNP